MITDNNKKLAQWAMDYALKNGCQAAKLVLYSNSNASFELRDAKMDRLQQASESGLSISLYVDGRYGSYSTNRLDKKELETFIKNGIESTRYLAVDEARVLPDASRYYKGGKPDLQLFDKRFETINPDDKVAIARAAAEEASAGGDGDWFEADGFCIQGFQGSPDFHHERTEAGAGRSGCLKSSPGGQNRSFSGLGSGKGSAAALPGADPPGA